MSYWRSFYSLIDKWISVNLPQGGKSVSNIYSIAAVDLVNTVVFFQYEILLNICFSALSIVSKSPSETMVYSKSVKKNQTIWNEFLLPHFLHLTLNYLYKYQAILLHNIMWSLFLAVDYIGFFCLFLCFLKKVYFVT